MHPQSHKTCLSRAYSACDSVSSFTKRPYKFSIFEKNRAFLHNKFQKSISRHSTSETTSRELTLRWYRTEVRKWSEKISVFFRSPILASGHPANRAMIQVSQTVWTRFEMAFMKNHESCLRTVFELHSILCPSFFLAVLHNFCSIPGWSQLKVRNLRPSLKKILSDSPRMTQILHECIRGLRLYNRCVATTCHSHKNYRKKMKFSGHYSSNSSSMNSLDQIGLEDKEDNEKFLNLKLSSKWNFYYLRNDKENWDDRLEFVGSFETIGQFWAVYHHIKLPSYLPQVNVLTDLTIWSTRLWKTFLTGFSGLRLYGFSRRNQARVDRQNECRRGKMASRNW